jgi:hypothetical protein
MLGLFKKPSNRLYELTVPINRGVACNLPINANPNVVVCYAAALNETQARELTIKRLEEGRCTIQAGWRVLEVDPKTWSKYIKTRWLRSHQKMPTQEAIDMLMKRGGFFYGVE